MKSIVIVIMISFVLFMLCLGFYMRSDIPYDFEIIPQDRSLVIVNTTSWASRDCDISIKSADKQYIGTLSADERYLKFDQLENGQVYTVSISRSDILGKIKYRNFQEESTPHEVNKYVVLVGASVAKKWNLRQLSARQNLQNTFFGYRGLYEFDKSTLIDNLVAMPLKPDAVIIKECAEYFPRNIDTSLSKIKQWAKQLEDADIEPILATVVPITKSRAKKNPTVQQGINDFNNAIRKYGDEKTIKILDLQAALSSHVDPGYLDETYADRDGLHLENVAYKERLDMLMINLINSNMNGISIK